MIQYRASSMNSPRLKASTDKVRSITRSLKREEHLDQVDSLEGHKMKLLASIIRCGRKLGFTSLLLVGTLALGTNLGFSSSLGPEKISGCLRSRR